MARILIADDDDVVGEIARDVLIAYGHGAGLVRDGAEALRVVRSRRPDLLVLDCSMPEMSGVNVLRAVRNDPKLTDLPVMMLTARRGREDVNLAMYAGADAYVKKPFDPDDFAFRVEELLDAKTRGG